jgi:hypothetical protein
MILQTLIAAVAGVAYRFRRAIFGGKRKAAPPDNAQRDITESK